MIPSSHLETYLGKHQRCACMCRSGGERTLARTGNGSTLKPDKMRIEG